MKLEFKIEGMHCSACSAKISYQVNKLSFVKNAEVFLLDKCLLVYLNDDCQARDYNKYINEIRAGVTKLGFKITEDKQSEQNISKQKESLASKIKLAISILCFIPLFVFEMGPMFFTFDFKITASEVVNNTFVIGLGLAQFFLTSIIIFIQINLYKKGFFALRQISPNMDSLIALSTSFAYLYSVYITGLLLTSTSFDFSLNLYHKLYFGTAASILVIVAFGKKIEENAKSKSSLAIQSLKKIRQEFVRVKRARKFILLPVNLLQKNDIIQIRAGEFVPADGYILSGNASLQEASITGEPFAKDKKKGDKVYASSLCEQGIFTMFVTSCGSKTIMGKLISLVEEALKTKAPIEKLADKISYYFVPFVLGTAFVSLVFNIIYTHDFAISLKRAISVMVVSCPCAIGLATPLAIRVAISIAAKNAILLRSAGIMEMTKSIDYLIFDKTGSLSKGSLHVSDFVNLTKEYDEDFYLTDAEIISKMAACERKSTHPLAKAIYNFMLHHRLQDSEYYKQVEDELKDFNFVYQAGEGIICQHENQLYFLGNFRLVKRVLTKVSSDKLKILVELENNTDGKSWLFFGNEKMLLACLAVQDELREEAKDLISYLHKEGIKTVILSGDSENAVLCCAKKLGISEYKSSLYPQEKLAYINELQARGHKVGMLGDGINDGPALAVADIGISLGSGTSLAIDASDIILLNDNLLNLRNTFALVRLCFRTIKQNLFWAFFYNVSLIPLAAGFFVPFFELDLSPMLAALAMSLSSLFVVFNSLAQRLKFKLQLSCRF